MPVVLEATQALESGNSLWILPDIPTYSWYQRLNWLTHFRLTANELHLQPKLHPWLVQIIEICEISLPEIPRKGPLLLPIGQWLPAEWLVTIPYDKDDPESFFARIQEVWTQFQHPSLRLFLPPQISPQIWEKYWTQQKLSSDISLVWDELPRT